MGSRSQTLWELIQSLDAAELLKFRERAFDRRRKGYPNYVKLFDAIKKQEIYDELEIEESLKDEPFVKHLHRTKNYLYHRILEFIRDAQEDEETDLSKLMDGIKIVYEKGLFSHLPPLLKRASKMAEKTEDFPSLRKLISFESGILRKRRDWKAYIEKIESLVKRSNQIFAKEKNLFELENIEKLFDRIWGQTGNEKVELLKKIESLENIHDPAFAISHSARIIQLYIQISIHNIKGKKEKVIKGCDEAIEVFKENKGLMADKERYYTLCRLILLGSLFRVMTHDFEGAKATFEGFRTLAKSHKRTPLEYLENKTIFSLSMGHKSCDPNLIFTCLDEYERLKSNSFSDTNVVSEITINHLAGTTLIYAGFPEKAIFWINNNRNRNDMDNRPDLLDYSRLLFLVCHWELGNVEVVDREVRSIRKSWGRKGQISLPISLILELFTALSQDPQGFKSILRSTSSSIEKEAHSASWQRFENYFDFSSWIQASLEGRSTMSIFQEKLKDRL